jgi:SAM-dependent methyltransferase
LSAGCPLCGGRGDLCFSGCRDLEYWIPWSSPFYRCGECTLVFMHPLPTREELPTLYPPNYHNYEPPSNRLDAFLQDRFHERHASISRRLLPPGGRFLEIGSARGDVLQRLRDGGQAQVQGVEISRESCEVAWERGLNVFHGTLEEFDADAPFDLIFMSHVIEHVLDPVATMARLFSLLAPGGVLYLETPNARALDARLWGRHWGLIHYPRHLYFFDRATLRRLVEGGGFGVERMSWEINSCGWALSIQCALRALGIDRARHARSSYYAPLLAACLPLNLLDLCFGGTAFMSAVARKPAA